MSDRPPRPLAVAAGGCVEGRRVSEPYYSDGDVTLWHGDCVDVMAELDAVDAVVTDPPYGLAFMGRSWDDFDPAEYQQWCQKWGEAALATCKPGAHLLAFGGTRTSHRLVCGLEDAGWTIRDSLCWLYGQGMCKSWNFDTRYDGQWCDCGANPLPYNHASDSDVSGLRGDIHPPSVARREGGQSDLLPGVQRDAPGPRMGEARPQGPGGLDRGSEKAFRERMTGSSNPAWRGGTYIEPDKGYRMVRKPDHPRARANGYVAEHLLVMEEMIGRPVRLPEEVHHINGDRADNRPKNLKLYPDHESHWVTEHMEDVHAARDAAASTRDTGDMERP